MSADDNESKWSAYMSLNKVQIIFFLLWGGLIESRGFFPKCD